MGNLIAAAFFAWGVAAYSFFAVSRRLPKPIRIKVYAGSVFIAVVVALAFAVTGALQEREALIGIGALLFGQAFAFGTHVWWLRLDVLNDPDWREEQGLPQYEGRSRRYWDVLLSLSPLHIIKYHRLAWSDPDSPARKYREQ